MFGGVFIEYTDFQKKIGLQQVDIAKKLDVDQATVSNWERGVCKPPRKYHKKLATLYGVDEIQIIEMLSGQPKKE